MTGLDVEKEHIIEMACLITDKDLNIVAEVKIFTCTSILWILGRADSNSRAACVSRCCRRHRCVMPFSLAMLHSFVCLKALGCHSLIAGRGVLFNHRGQGYIPWKYRHWPCKAK